jgi:hypothetical protein
MMANQVIVTTKHGNAPTFATCPEGPGLYPGIIFLHDAPGKELRNMAQRIAKQPKADKIAPFSVSYLGSDSEAITIDRNARKPR